MQLFLDHKIGIDLTVSPTLKKPSKNYMFYFETFRIILNPSSVKKQSNNWQCYQFKTKRLCDARNKSVMQKTSKAKSRPPTLTNSLKVKAGPTAMQKVLK